MIRKVCVLLFVEDHSVWMPIEVEEKREDLCATENFHIFSKQNPGVERSDCVDKTMSFDSV